MRLGCGAPLLIALLAVVALCAQAGAQAKEIELQHLPPGSHRVVPPVPAISCDVSSPSVAAGQSVEVTTRVIQGNAAGLKYSFETTAGRLTVASANASTARLDTAGVAGGEINVNCVVVDPYGRRVAYGKTIRLGTGSPTGALLPGHSPTAKQGPPKIEKEKVPDVEHVAPPPPPPPPVAVPKPDVSQPTAAAKPPAPGATAGATHARTGAATKPGHVPA